jgi:hypothetical protein
MKANRESSAVGDRGKVTWQIGAVPKFLELIGLHGEKKIYRVRVSKGRLGIGLNGIEDDCDPRGGDDLKK